MRTLVDIPEPELRALDELGARRSASRAKLIREAVRDYLERNQSGDLDAAFGLWRGGEDGLADQERLRGEW
jgi:metal-responsive CopG/Arc/MetJ family transcriptional regulator